MEPCASPFCPDPSTDSVELTTIEYHLCRRHAEEMYRAIARKHERAVLWTKNAPGIDA